MKTTNAFVICCLVATLNCFLGGIAWGEDSVTTFYIVRHAERQDATNDSDLSDAGIRRADELRRVLRTTPIGAVYATNYRRTQKTIQPIASAANLNIENIPDASEVGDWLARLPDLHEGQNVVIAAHSGAAGSAYAAAGIAQALVQEPVPAILGDQYNKLLVVQIRKINGVVTREFHLNWFGPLEKLGLVNVSGTLEEDDEISAVINTGDFLVVGADEKDQIQSLKSNGNSSFTVQAAHSLSNQGELDIEAIARRQDTYFVLGSHSMVRRKVDSRKTKTLKKPYLKNRERFLIDEIKPEKSRDRIYSLNFDPATGQPPAQVEVILELDDLFETHPVLGLFNNIPSKENGIDIEGLAIDATHLYLGFRGPVFRLGHVPVLKIDPNAPDDSELLFVNLGGAGIRDLRKTSDGFLIVAGPNGDSSQPYQLYFWDGLDCVPGVRSSDDPLVGQTTLLGRIPTPPGAKAEGIAVLSETDGNFEVLVVYDNLANGGLTRFRAPCP